MADYLVTDAELTSIASAIRTKGGTSASLSFPTEFVSAIQNIPTGGATLQSKTKSYTPSETAQNETVAPDTGYDGLSSVAVSVGAIPSNYVGSGITRRDDDDMSGVYDDPYYMVVAPSGYYPNSAEFEVPTGSLVGNVHVSVLSSDINLAINNDGLITADFYTGETANPVYQSGYIDNSATTYASASGSNSLQLTKRTSNDLTVSGTTVTAPSGYYPSNASITVSGGASNIVTGTFTTGSSAGVTNIPTGYTGSGYPILAMVFVEGGSYVSGTTWYTTIQRYAVGFWSMSKSVQNTAPSYTTSGTQNQGVVTSIYKSSTSSSTSYTRNSAMNTNVYSSNNASNSAVNVIKLKANNTLSYYTNTSSYGLMPNITYRYYIIYSS